MASPWDRRSPAEQERLRDLMLDGWIDAVAAFSPYWQRCFAEAGVDPGRVDSVESLRALPPVRESDIAGAGGTGAPALLLRPTEAQVKARASFSTLWRIAATIRGGGEGAARRALLAEYKPVHLHEAGRDGRLTIGYSRSDLDRLHRAGARAAAVLGLDDGDYLVSAVPRGTGLEFWGLYHLALGSSMLALHPRGSDEDLAATLRAFDLVPATAVAVPAGGGVELAATVTEHDVDATRVRTVVTVGPPLTRDRRDAVRDAWRAAGAPRDVRVLAVWAPSEARALWAECRAGSGLHTYPDLELLEVLDAATGRVSSGDGDLTYTSTGWNGTGLVRYQTGDHVAAVDGGACEHCGRTVPRIRAPITPGIWQPRLRTKAAAVRLDLRAVAAVLEGVGLGPWRVELRRRTARGREEGYAVFLGDEPDDRDALAARLAEVVGPAPLAVEVEQPQEVDAAIARGGGPFTDRR